MGRYKVRMHLRTTDAQPVWKEYTEYMTTASKGASEKRKLTQYVTNTVLPHAIRPMTLKNPNQRLVATREEKGHEPHTKTVKHPTSSTEVGTTTMPDQRLVAGGGEEDHQPHPKTMEHPTSSMDDGTPNKPDIPTVSIESMHDDGPTSSKPLPQFNPDGLIGKTFLLPPGDNGGKLRAKVTRKVAKVIKKADGERVQKLSYILGIENGKVEEILSYSQLMDHFEAA